MKLLSNLRAWWTRNGYDADDLAGAFVLGVFLYAALWALVGN